MKALILVIICLVTFLNISFAKAVNITAYFGYNSFNSPTNEPYVETYLTFLSSSLALKPNTNAKYQSAIKVDIEFTQNGNKITAASYTVDSPEFNDTLKTYNFVDLKRYNLSNGKYKVNLSISDVNAINPKPFKGSDSITIDFQKDSVVFSNVELLESYTKSASPSMFAKSGFEMVPYVANFFPENMNSLKYYCEIYNTDKQYKAGEQLVVNLSILHVESNVKLTKYHAFKKVNVAPIIPSLNDINITELPSGNYYLVLELRDKKNQVIAEQRIFFQRSNSQFQIRPEDIATVSIENSFVVSITNKDTLAEYIRCLSPISNQMERNFAQNSLKSSDLETLQKFFLNFWQSRSATPEQEWKKYAVQVNYVNRVYGNSVQKGYVSDRGRVYLQYGAPNQMAKFDYELNSYPYEIWHYYKTDKRNNRRFVFYDRSLTGLDYTLLHSDAPGEPRDDRWQTRLNSRNNQNTNFDDNGGSNEFGSHAKDFYTNPR